MASGEEIFGYFVIVGSLTAVGAWFLWMLAEAQDALRNVKSPAPKPRGEGDGSGQGTGNRGTQLARPLTSGRRLNSR